MSQRIRPEKLCDSCLLYSRLHPQHWEWCLTHKAWWILLKEWVSGQWFLWLVYLYSNGWFLYCLLLDEKMFDSPKSRFYWVSHLFLGMILIMSVRILERNSGNFKLGIYKVDHKGASWDTRSQPEGVWHTRKEQWGAWLPPGFKGQEKSTMGHDAGPWRELADGSRRPGEELSQIRATCRKGWQEQMLGFYSPPPPHGFCGPKPAKSQRTG